MGNLLNKLLLNGKHAVRYHIYEMAMHRWKLAFKPKRTCNSMVVVCSRPHSVEWSTDIYGQNRP